MYNGSILLGMLLILRYVSYKKPRSSFKTFFLLFPTLVAAYKVIINICSKNTYHYSCTYQNNYKIDILLVVIIRLAQSNQNMKR